MRRIGLALLALIVLFLWWNMVRRAMAGPSSQINDFIRFSRDLLFERRNVYVEYEPTYTITKYPPFFAFLFAPLVPLPMAVAASIWFWLNLALSVGAAILAAQTVADGSAAGRGEARWSRRQRAILPYLLAAPVVISNLESGQVNIVIVFLICMTLLLHQQGKDLAAGGFLGAVIALKLTPALFLAYFAWKRAPRVLVGAAAGLVLCWGVAPLLAFGTEFYAEVMREWVRSVVPFLAEGTLAEGMGGFRHTNQSLSAVVVRFLTDIPAGGGREGLTVNVISLGLETARWIVRGLSVAIVVFLAWICDRPTDAERPFAARHPSRYGLECGLVMIAVLFLSPISWINHYVILIFPYAAAAAWLSSRPETAPGWRILKLAMWISFALLLTSVSVLLLAFSLPFMGAVALGAGLVVAIRREGTSVTTGARPVARPLDGP